MTTLQPLKNTMNISKFSKSKVYYFSFFVMVISLIFVGFSFFPFTPSEEKPDKNKLLIQMINALLKQGHYNHKIIDDAFGGQVYEDFIDKLDPNKYYFTSKEIEQFAFYKNKIDEQLIAGQDKFFKLVMAYYQTQVKNVQRYYRNYLSKPIDFEKKDSIASQWKNFPKDTLQLKKRWHKILRSQVMGHIKFLQKREQNKKNEDIKFQLSSFDTLEKSARKKVLERFDERYKVLAKRTQEEWFTDFLNSITTVFDPHTAYFSPAAKNTFDTHISGKLEGIGATLQEKGDYIKVVNLIVGGPAWKQGDLKANHLIIKVQQEGKDPVDIMGMSINNVIKLIKGKKGTKVILTVQKLDKTYLEITITRDVVELEEAFLKSSIVTAPNGKRYGYIYLPQFYINFKQRNSRSATSDMEKVLAGFNEEKVVGILLDLRRNGGGSLDTAIDIGGFFIKKGAIVQVRYKNQVQTYKDRDPKIRWKKPLVIMVDVGSASASEILAAAMQDYGRAVIIGTQTFGKGTVQNILDLNRYARYPQPLGALKLTIQKFYRVNGGSTQIKGVTPDIKYPDLYKYQKVRERDKKNVLAWDSIPAVLEEGNSFYSNFKTVVATAQKRIDNEVRFQRIKSYAKAIKDTDSITYYPLTLAESKIADEKVRKKMSKYENLSKHKSTLKFSPTHLDKRNFVKDTLDKQRKMNWLKSLPKDMYITEGVSVLSQLKMKPLKK